MTLPKAQYIPNPRCQPGGQLTIALDIMHSSHSLDSMITTSRLTRLHWIRRGLSLTFWDGTKKLVYIHSVCSLAFHSADKLNELSSQQYFHSGCVDIFFPADLFGRVSTLLTSLFSTIFSILWGTDRQVPFYRPAAFL